MGALQTIDIQKLKDHFDLSFFVETGTGIGLSLQHVIQYKFDKYFSVEIVKEVYDMAIQSYDWPDNVTILNSDSISALNTIFNEIPKEKNILFWLDSHFPGMDYQGVSFFTHKNQKNINLPLESELRFIKNNRNNQDVIICDDVRIYQDGNFSGGNWPERPFMNAGNLDFAYELFEDTHDLNISFLDQGYLFITPK